MLLRRRHADHQRRGGRPGDHEAEALEIIDNEDKSNPLSEEAGYNVARRTVTKYRKMGNIPSSRQRKDWTTIHPPSKRGVKVSVHELGCSLVLGITA